MSTVRKDLQKALCRYVEDTIVSVDSVRAFCEKLPKWLKGMEAHRDLMKDIELVKELDKVLSAVLAGLAELDRFLDAVEKLAVTSRHVFAENRALLTLAAGGSLKCVRDAVAEARLACPLVLEFRRDAKAFFLPRLQNLEVLVFQLDEYIKTTSSICKKFGKSSLIDFDLETKPVVRLDAAVSDDDIRRMLDHVNQLDEIRMNQPFRTVVLFMGQHRGFVDEFSQRKPSMLQCLTDLEETAVQLDSMNKGAKISSVVGSSVGGVGGVLSIIGLALIPVTAGISLGLTMTGLGMGVTSAANGIVTNVTEMAVNSNQHKKARTALQGLMEHMQIIQDGKDPANQSHEMEQNMVWKVFKLGKALTKVTVSVVASLKNERVVQAATRLLARNGPALRGARQLSSDNLNFGRPVALTKSARAGLIAVNALFIGMDIFFICKDSISLAKGSETKVSQFIRARAALWNSEIEAWQKILDLLHEGLETSEKMAAVLETPFYPESAAGEQSESKRENQSKQEREILEEKICLMQLVSFWG